MLFSLTKTALSHKIQMIEPRLMERKIVMGNNSPLDIIIYNILRIINSVNIVLLLSILLSSLHFNKYLSFTILIIFAGITVVISRYIFDVVLKIKNESIESTMVYKILSLLSIIGLFAYLAFNFQWMLLFIMIVIFTLFVLGIGYLTKKEFI